MPSRSAPPPEERPTAPAGRLLETWHLSEAEELAGLRAAVTACAGAAGHAETAGSRLVLVVNEVATNALKYGGPPVTVQVHQTAEGWLVDVRDGSGARAPLPQPPANGRPGGHGLRIVAHVSIDWGWYREEATAPGKHVWAHVAAGSLGPVAGPSAAAG